MQRSNESFGGSFLAESDQPASGGREPGAWRQVRQPAPGTVTLYILDGEVYTHVVA